MCSFLKDAIIEILFGRYQLFVPKDSFCTQCVQGSKQISSWYDLVLLIRENLSLPQNCLTS
jgi:hypothetical protein